MSDPVINNCLFCKHLIETKVDSDCKRLDLAYSILVSIYWSISSRESMKLRIDFFISFAKSGHTSCDMLIEKITNFGHSGLYTKRD